MKRLSFSCVVAFILIFALPEVADAMPNVGDSILVELPQYEQRMIKRKAMWSKLMPELFNVQYAGGIGCVSAGLGWDYGSSQQWETHVLVGYIPKRYNYPNYWTLTIRETYNPWKINIGRHCRVSPLTVGVAINSLLHKNFWTSEPDRYPSGYYGFSSRVRFHLGIGQRFTYVIPDKFRYLSSRMSFYYEISTCDLYLRQKFINKTIPLKDIITLGVGVQWAI